MKSKTSSLNPKTYGLLAALAVFAVGAVASLAVYVAAEGAMKSEIRSSLGALSRSASQLVDAPAFATISSPDQKDGGAYQGILATFKKIAAGDSNLADLYTMTQGPDGKIRFIVDTLPEGGEPPADIGEVYDDASVVLKKAFDSKTALVEDRPYTDKWGTVLSAYAPITDADGNMIGMTGVDMHVEQYQARLNLVREALAIGLLITLVCAGIAGFTVFVLRRAANLNYERSRAQQQQLAEMEAQRAEEQAQSERRAAEARRQAMFELAENFEASVQTALHEVVAAADLLQAESQRVSSISSDTRERSEAVSRISNDAAQTSAQVAAASEELTASIREIRDQTERSQAVVRSAAEKGGVAKEVIERLSKSSSRIGEVVDVINDIAGQINLLALNATIESARAGEAGKGFAVVANEVKSLSGQVSKALAEISSQIHDIQSETKHSVEAMNDILGIIGAVTEGTVVVAAAVSQQSDVTREISHNIHATAQGSREIADTMVNVLSSAGETGETAQRVWAATTKLQQQSQDLSRAVDGFLQRVRA